MYVIEVGKRWFLQVWTVKWRGRVLFSGLAWTIDSAAKKARAKVEVHRGEHSA